MSASRRTRTVFVALAKATTGLAHLLILAVLARVLTKSDLATYQQVFLAYAFVAPFLQLGIGQGFYYFLPVEKTRSRGRIADAIVVMATTGAMFAAFIAFGGNRLIAQAFENPQISILLLWLIPYAILVTPSSQAQHALISQGQEIRSTKFTLSREVIICVSTLAPLLYTTNVSGPLIGNICSSIAMAFVAFRLMSSSTPASASSPTISGIRELVSYAVPLGLAVMVGTLFKQLDKLVVSILRSPEEFAVYSLGAIEIPLITIVTGSITAVILADMRQAVSKNHFEEAVALFRKIAEKSAYILLPSTAFLLICADSLIALLFSSEYADSSIPFRIYLATVPTRIVLFGTFLAILGKSKTFLKITILSLLANLVLTWLLVSQLGPNGAAIATVAVILFWQAPASCFAISKAIKTPIKQILPWAVLLKSSLLLVALSTALWVLYNYLSGFDHVWRLGICAGVFGIPIIIWWGQGLLFDWKSIRNND